jgi:hypothetical protein
MFRRATARHDRENVAPSASNFSPEPRTSCEDSNEFIDDIKTRIDRIMEIVNRNDRILHMNEKAP